jgi:hypothetical protein
MAKAARRKRSLKDAGGLFGPDAADTVEITPEGERIITLGNGLDINLWQWVNRWVFFDHHRAPALRELRALVDRVRAGER